MKHIFIMGLLSLTLQASAQPFETTFDNPSWDFNHYSIENSGNEYVLAGTIFDNVNGNNDIHIIKLDQFGVMVWERRIDVSSDDRGLDVVVDNNQEIVVCGYVHIAGVPTPYVVKLGPGGNFVADVTIAGTAANGAATNIIYSQINNAYIVGGFYASNFGYPLTGNDAFVCEVPINIPSGPTWLTTFSAANQRHCSVNDIVEIPTGFFVTGSFDRLGWGTACLAYFIDFAGTPTADLSFNSSNSTHQGVSAVYTGDNDCIYLMSNNSGFHNPQITPILSVSSTPTHGTSYYLELDPTYGQMNAAGFQLRQSITDPDRLVAAGYYAFYPSIYNPNTTTWLAEFNRASGANFATLVRPATTPTFQTHGGFLFAPFFGQFPYIYNPEILAYRADNAGYCTVGPTTVVAGSANISLQVEATTMAPGPVTPPDIPCLDPYNYKEYPMNLWPEPCGAHPTRGFLTNLFATPVPETTTQVPTCKLLKPAPTAINKIVDINGITAYPNPVSHVLQLDMNLDKTSQLSFSFYDLLGREVLTQKRVLNNGPAHLQIEISQLQSGYYLMKVSDNEGMSRSLKIEKE